MSTNGHQTNGTHAPALNGNDQPKPVSFRDKFEKVTNGNVRPDSFHDETKESQG